MSDLRPGRWIRLERNARTICSYDPYGVTTQTDTATGNSQQYTGRENDGIGLYYYRARYYSPANARFTQEDPIGWASGQANEYAYVGGNPISYTDPAGLLCFNFNQFADDIENNRSSTAADLAALLAAGAVGTMPKTPDELRGFGLPKDELNPWTSQLSRWSSRLGARELRDFGRTVGGKVVSGAATAALVADGLYNWYVIGQAAVDATSSDDNCGCGK